MAAAPPLRFEPVDTRTWPDLQRLFESRGGPHSCWCMVWRGTPAERRGKVARKAADTWCAWCFRCYRLPMRRVITLATGRREALVDITSEVRQVVAESGIRDGLVSVYAQGATAAIMIQENWDNSVQIDVVRLLRMLIPRGEWLHDEQDGNGDSHLKSGLVGPSETVPIIDGELGLSTWQSVFFCEFDGPRERRRIVCTVVGAEP